jgi:hypothetical protein
MPVHPARRTLERDLLPYFVSARLLERQWFFRLHTVFGYTTDLVVALSAIGVSAPLLTMLAASNGDPHGAKPPGASAVLATVPAWLAVPTIILMLTWVVFRVAFNREDGQKRAVLVKSCTQVLRQAEASLAAVLAKSDPMPALNELLERNIRPTVDRTIQENAWPWLPFAPGIEAQVQREVAVLCDRFEEEWTPVGPLGLRPATVTRP